MAELPDSKARASCDLDGVITVGPGKTPYDFAPVRTGARDFLRTLHERYEEVIIHTARPVDAAKNYLRQNGLLKYVADVTNTKLPSKVYIDDRAVAFTGDFEKTLEEVEDFRPYWAKSASDVGLDDASTQFDLPPDLAAKVISMGKNVPDSMLHGKGREEHPHITVLYGIEDETPDKLAAALKNFGRVRARLGATSFFRVQKKGFDVVKLTVASEDLKRLRKAVEAASKFHTDFPDYVPHATIAYTKLGSGEKFSGDRTLAGEECVFDALTFYGSNGERTRILLT
jgi:2'-5' RNA ligase